VVIVIFTRNAASHKFTMTQKYACIIDSTPNIMAILRCFLQRNLYRHVSFTK